jgi:uncharacterized protein YfaS (alpha-2-macroglobulin family)
VPVRVYNNIDEPQSILVEVFPSDGIDLIGDTIKSVEAYEKEISVTHFRIRVTESGLQSFKVSVSGTTHTDTLQKEVRVLPDGYEISFSLVGRQQFSEQDGKVEVNERFEIPDEAVPDTQMVDVKIYPGIFSYIVEGLDSILQMADGCFEQITSLTYPNILVLDYMNNTNQTAAGIRPRVEQLINLGYQKMTTFEVENRGGFSLCGDQHPDLFMTAYGLQVLSDMSRVGNVDTDLIQRAANWIFSQQYGEGYWEDINNDSLPLTAFIVWSLVDAGFSDDERTQTGMLYIKDQFINTEDPHVLSLIANAMVAEDIRTGAEITEATLTILDRLVSLVVKDEYSALWRSEVGTLMGSEDIVGSIETTALVTLAFLRANRHLELANEAINTLVQMRDNFGTWHTTQATVFTLKALLQSIRSSFETSDASVSITLNDSQTRTININQWNLDEVQIISFDDIDKGKENSLNISVEGEGSLMYQVSGGLYLPWESISNFPQFTGGSPLVDIDVAYDQTSVSVNDVVAVDVSLSLVEGFAKTFLVELGIPPGFTVEMEDLSTLVKSYERDPEDRLGTIVERFELTGQQILIYISNLSVKNPLEFSYRLKAIYPSTTKTPPSRAYDFYNPGVLGVSPPQLLIVNP